MYTYIHTYIHEDIHIICACIHVCDMYTCIKYTRASASWHVKFNYLGRKYASKIGLVNTHMRVRDDW
jgi:hypothetical protein